MNENYDKFRPLLEPNKAILVVGEVNTGEDKPKIFPQEIMPLEDAPKKYTKQVHLRLHTAHLQPDLFSFPNPSLTVFTAAASALRIQSFQSVKHRFP
jgi:hypothetical protein